MRGASLLAFLVAAALPGQPAGDPAGQAIALLHQGKLDQAEAIFQRLYKKDPPDIRGLIGLAEVLAARRQAPQALSLLEAGRKQFPNDPNLDASFASIATRAGRTDLSIPILKRLTAAFPKQFDLQMQLADAYRVKGDLLNALPAWEAAGILQPQNVTPIVNRAMSLEALRRPKEAAPLYAAALKIDPNNLIALNNYSFFLAESGANSKNAVAYAEHAFSLAPANPMVADTLGFVYIKTAQPAAAIAHYRRQMARFPNVNIFHIHLAEALLMNGDGTAAAQELDSAAAAALTPAERGEWNRVSAKRRNSPTAPRVR